MDPYSSRLDEPTRRRRRTTQLELEILEAEFQRCDKPSIAERERISDVISRTDIDGPGMNGREIQVWFQNKRQAIRRAQGVYPHCETMSDRDRARYADELLFGINLTQDHNTTPPDSFTSPDAPRSCSSSASLNHANNNGFVPPRHGLSTPPFSAGRHDRRAQLVLSDLGNGRAELMFSPTPLKPSSPPRVPSVITPIRTPLSRKIAARSASSPALMSSRGSLMHGPALRESSATAMNEAGCPATPSYVSESRPLSVLRSLKRPHSFMSSSNKEQGREDHGKRRSAAASKSSFSHDDLGRGKENVPPGRAIFSTPITASTTKETSNERAKKGEGDGYGRDIRRIQSENLNKWASPPRSTPKRPLAVRANENRKVPDVDIVRKVPEVSGGELGPKKMSAEECALSLVSLAHGV